METIYQKVLKIYYLSRSYFKNIYEAAYITEAFSNLDKLSNSHPDSEMIKEYIESLPSISEFQLHLIPLSISEKLLSFLKALPLYIFSGLGVMHLGAVTIEDIQANSRFLSKRRQNARNDAHEKMQNISKLSLKLLQTIKPNSVDYLK